MLDEFVHSHPQVVLLNQRIAILNESLRDAFRICHRRDVPPLVRNVYEHISVTGTQNLAITLELESYLASKQWLNIPRVDRLLLETVALHQCQIDRKMQQKLDPKAGKAIAIMGSMIQERLTALLLNIQSSQRSLIFKLGTLPAMTQPDWEVSFLGAAAAVRAIKGFHGIDGVIIRLPTIEEDVDHGIDLFVETTTGLTSERQHHLNLAVSVKSVKRPLQMYGERLLCGTTPNANGAVAQQMRIIRGACAMRIRYSRRFLPVRILVGRPHDVDYRIFVEPSEILVLKQLLDQTEPALRSSRRSVYSDVA